MNVEYDSNKLNNAAYSNARMIRCSAGTEYNAATSAYDIEVRLETTQSDLVSIEIDTSTHRVDDRFRLLIDFLLHKMVELALHDLGNFKLECLDGTNTGLALFAAKTMNMKLPFSYMGDIVILKVKHTFSMLDHSTRVRGNEELDRLWNTLLRHKSTRLCTSHPRSWGHEEFAAQGTGGVRRNYSTDVQVWDQVYSSPTHLK